MIGIPQAKHYIVLIYKMAYFCMATDVFTLYRDLFYIVIKILDEDEVCAHKVH